MLKKLMAVVGIGIAGIFMLVIGFVEFRETGKLQAGGKKTEGEVTGFEERSGRRGKTKYYVTASFKTESGQSVETEQRVSPTVFSQAVHSKTIPVVYLPSEPEICRFGAEVKKDYAGLGIGMFLVGCSVVAGFRRNSEE